MRILGTLIMALAIAGNLFAAKEPKGVTNARKSVVSILIYKDGTLLRSGVGVSVGNKGEILSSYTLFADADSAVAIDNSGKARPIQHIIGADDIYDCIKVCTAWDKKISSLSLSAQGATTGSTLYLVGYGIKKSAPVENLTVTNVDTISGKPYYTLSFDMKEHYMSAPLVNDAGELVALMQPAMPGDSINSYAIAASRVDELATTPLTYGSTLYSHIDIPCALPPTQKDALTTLYLLENYAYGGQKDKFLIPLAHYKALYPDSYEGHLMHAQYLALVDTTFDAAHAEWHQALQKTDNKADVYYNISKVFVSASTSLASTVEEAYSYIDSALIYIDTALTYNAEPLYTLHKAQLHKAKNEHAQAFDNYAALSGTPLSSADVYLAAAQCKEALGEYPQAIEQMDSAIATFGSLPIAAMAPYIIERAAMKHRAGRSREAVLDYNLYASLKDGSLNAYFYFAREQAEYNAKMFQQALDDIEMAIYLMPDEIMFLIEKGRLCYRVKLVDEAIATLKKAEEISADNPDVHYLLGRCYMIGNNIPAARTHMQKALELGHPDAGARLEEL